MLDDTADRRMAYFHVNVGDVEDREAVETRRQILERDRVVLYFDARGIAAAAPIQPEDLQHPLDQGMALAPVLGVEEDQSLAEDLRFVITLDAEPLFRVQRAEALLQFFQNFAIHGERLSTGCDVDEVGRRLKRARMIPRLFSGQV